MVENKSKTFSVQSLEDIFQDWLRCPQILSPWERGQVSDVLNLVVQPHLAYR